MAHRVTVARPPARSKAPAKPTLTLSYDREADILYITKRAPYKAQESEELGDEVIARLNPKTHEVESLEILFFSTRLLKGSLLELPLTAELRLAV